MSKKKHTIDNSIEDFSLVPDEDFEFEKQVADFAKNEKAISEGKLLEQKKREHDNKAEYERKLRQEKIELMRLKQGIADDNDVEETTPIEKPKMSFKKRVGNFWYHNKFTLIVGVFVFIAVGYMIYDVVSKTKPDMTVLVTLDNGMSYRTDELEKFFEKYCEDYNGDGKVYVEIVSTPLNPDTADTDMTQANATRFFAHMQSGKNVLILSDVQTEGNIVDLIDNLHDKYPEQEHYSEKGLMLDGDYIRKELNWAEMPDDMYLALRKPINTTYSSKDEMRKHYERSLKMLELIAEDMDKCESDK